MPKRTTAKPRTSRTSSLHNTPSNPLYQQVSCCIQGEFAIVVADHGKAAVAADQLLSLAFNPQGNAYNAGCWLSQCVGLVDRDTKLAERRRKDLAQSYGE